MDIFREPFTTFAVSLMWGDDTQDYDAVDQDSVDRLFMVINESPLVSYPVVIGGSAHDLPGYITLDTWVVAVSENRAAAAAMSVFRAAMSVVGLWETDGRAIEDLHVRNPGPCDGAGGDGGADLRELSHLQGSDIRRFRARQG